MKYWIVYLFFLFSQKCVSPEKASQESIPLDNKFILFYDYYRSHQYEKSIKLLEELIVDYPDVSPSIYIVGNDILLKMVDECDEIEKKDSLLSIRDKIMQTGSTYFNFDITNLSLDDLSYRVVTKSARPKDSFHRWNSRLEEKLRIHDCILLNRKDKPVLIEFTIDIDGSFLDPKLLKGDTSRCINKLFFILENDEKWIPAELDGKIVRQKITRPIQFK